MIFAKERAKRELLKEFPDQVLNAYLPNRAREFVDAVVVPYAEAYQELREQTYSAANGAEKVNRWLKRLVQLDNSDWRPPALWALRHHGDDPVWLDEFFRSLERLAASMLIRRVYTSPRSNRYADLLRNLDDDQGLHAQAFELSPQEKAETLSSLDGELYLATKVRKYVLLRLDEVLAGAGGVVYDHPLVTVEHVLPQNPSWDSEWLRTFSPAERVRWTHRIANLVVLNRAKNSQAQNFDFDKKKERYFTSKKGVVNFALTSQVLNQQVWTPSLLQTRQEELLAALSKEWGLD
jgi:hypothetical protein